MKNNKNVIVAIVLVLCLAGCSGCTFFGANKVDGEKAHSDKKNRYITVVNDTGKTINLACVKLGNGEAIDKCYQENPDSETIHFELPKAYKDYEEFKVVFIDNHELMYEKDCIIGVEESQVTVTMTEDDYKKRDGDWKRKIEELMNND